MKRLLVQRSSHQKGLCELLYVQDLGAGRQKLLRSMVWRRADGSFAMGDWENGLRAGSVTLWTGENEKLSLPPAALEAFGEVVGRWELDGLTEGEVWCSG